MDEGCWIADIADEAPALEKKAGFACDRAVLTPDTGSALELGQTRFEDFFLIDQFAESPLGCVASVLDGLAGMVEVDELDPTEEEEFDLCRLFRGMNIRETSSAFIEDRAPCPPLPESYHPKRGPVCTLGGDATAVMEKEVDSGRICRE
jgi:hypothetical protein